MSRSVPSGDGHYILHSSDFKDLCITILISDCILVVSESTGNTIKLALHLPVQITWLMIEDSYYILTVIQ